MKIAIFICLTFLYLTCTTKEQSGVQAEGSQTDYTNPEILFFPKSQEIEEFIHTEFRSENGIVIQNSYPKGGGDIDGQRGFSDAQGRSYGNAIFFTRIINESSKPVELRLRFPSDSLTIYETEGAYLKLLLPPDTMKASQVSDYSYGIKGLRKFLEANFYKEGMIQRRIEPGQDTFIYVAAMGHLAGGRGSLRTAMEINGTKLYYKAIAIPGEFDAFSCGEIIPLE